MTQAFITDEYRNGAHIVHVGGGFTLVFDNPDQADSAKRLASFYRGPSRPLEGNRFQTHKEIAFILERGDFGPYQRLWVNQGKYAVVDFTGTAIVHRKMDGTYEVRGLGEPDTLRPSPQFQPTAIAASVKNLQVAAKTAEEKKEKEKQKAAPLSNGMFFLGVGVLAWALLRKPGGA
jgi:hypothetical protein